MEGKTNTNAQYSCEENESVLQCKNSEGHQTLVALVDWTRHSMSHTAQYRYTRHTYNLHCQYNNVQLYSGTYA